MATKSFLTPEERAEALRLFPAPSFFAPNPQHGLGMACSAWMGEQLLKKLGAVDGWIESRPIALGSWARGELCPKSDIDMIFAGPQEVVQKYVGQIQARGLKLRSRLPEDITVQEIAGWCAKKPENDVPPLVIDGSDPGNYKLAA